MSDFWKGDERMELDLRESGWNQFISLLSIQKKHEVDEWSCDLHTIRCLSYLF